ncbi:IclR family transcriptional regulator [Planomonospora venezuelensis]|uniref:IclR family acetate operon transcriptional repressor n=1 Tax=Planomonospora venezuelensis TaxID=1999 RepID=A0A841DF92_PLAVE|nr:IclR family transcriptional regulator [Planomonospora venezuelensis]MBB5967413.1 IclR family acetate operon transcriptional repressor [Planomonospora venezuelensis]
MDANPSPVESVDRALRILQLLSRSATGLTLDELVSASGLPRSSLHRLLAALKHRGFAAQYNSHSPYFLGSEAVAVAFGYYERMDLRTLIRPVMVTLQQRLQETVHMAMLDGGDVVYMDKVESTQAMRITSVIGGRNPAHCTGVGKAMLAWTYPTDEAIRMWIEKYAPLTGRTRNTLTSPARLIAELARIRDEGHAVDMEESEDGVRCVAIPVFFGKPAPVAGISVTAPKGRMTVGRMNEIAAELKREVIERMPPGSD